MSAVAAMGQKWLGRTGLYQRLRASRVYDIYWRFADPKILAERDREVQFYRSLLQGLRKGSLVYDIGANHGYKTDIFLRLGARVVAVDPDLTNQAILAEKFLRYRFKKKPVALLGKAVSREVTVMTMFIDEPGSAKNTLSTKWVDALRDDAQRFGHTLQFKEQRQVTTTTVAEMVATYGPPLFVKIDVEGFELDVIAGMQAPVPYLSFEVNLPEFLEEGLNCVALLARLSDASEFNYSFSISSGLALGEWLNAEKFATVLRNCRNESIEIFCRTPQR